MNETGDNLDDEFIRAGLDPDFKLAPMPERSAEALLDERLAAVERAVNLERALTCPLCKVPPRPTSWDRFGYPRQADEFHSPGCPADGH